MIMAEIAPLSTPMANFYLVRQQGTILIDSGPPGQGKRVLKKLQDLSIDQKDLSLIVVTHGHWDHIGSLHELKAMTGCKVAINHRERDWVEKALKPLPPAMNLWGRIFRGLIRPLANFARFSATSVDIILEDAPFPLQPFGIDGKVLHTPGHTAGSVTVLLETGDAFIGDLAFNGMPLRIGAGMPCYGDSADAIRKSWRLILDHGAKRIYPAHGKPFDAEVLRKEL